MWSQSCHFCTGGFIYTGWGLYSFIHKFSSLHPLAYLFTGWTHNVTVIPHFLLFGILCYWSAGCYSNIILHFLSTTFSTHEYLAFVATLNILIVARSHGLSISFCSFMVVTCVSSCVLCISQAVAAVNIILQILFLACSEDNMLILHSSFQHLLFGTLFMIMNVMTSTTHAPYFI